MRFISAILGGALFCAVAATWAPPAAPYWQSLPFAQSEALCGTDAECAEMFGEDDDDLGDEAEEVFPWEL